MRNGRNEKGSVIVLVTIALVVILGFTALVIDGGRVYLGKSDLQNAADAAALAGAQDLPSDVNAKKTAITYAGINGMKATQSGVKKDGDTVTVTPSYNGDPTKIEVVCTRTVEHSLARILGFTQSDVSARAVAQKTRSSWDPAFYYAVFAGSDDKTKVLNFQNSVKVMGDAHSNHKIDFRNSATVNGSVTAVSTVEMSNSTKINGTCQASKITLKNSASIVGDATQISAPRISMPADFDDVIESQFNGAISTGNLTINNKTPMPYTDPIYIKGDLTISNTTTIDCPIYVDGTISINNSCTYLGNCIFATGNITISNSTDFSGGNVLVYSKNGNITTQNSTSGSAHAVLFAPKGNIEINNSSFAGRAIGNTVNLTNSGAVTGGAEGLDVLPGEDAVKLVE